MAEEAKVRVDQAKVRADQAKVSVEELKQQTQSQVKLLEATSGVIGGTRQQKHKVASRPIRQPSDELGGSTLGIFVKFMNFTAHMWKLTIR